jgi:hypothetical protein
MNLKAFFIKVDLNKNWEVHLPEFKKMLTNLIELYIEDD